MKQFYIGDETMKKKTYLIEFTTDYGEPRMVSVKAESVITAIRTARDEKRAGEYIMSVKEV